MHDAILMFLGHVTACDSLHNFAAQEKAVKRQNEILMVACSCFGSSWRVHCFYADTLFYAEEKSKEETEKAQSTYTTNLQASNTLAIFICYQPMKLKRSMLRHHHFGQSLTKSGFRSRSRYA